MFFKIIEPGVKTCPTMAYKTDWHYQFSYEKEKPQNKFPKYKILSSDSNRRRNYSKHEIEKLVYLRKAGYTINEISKEIGRTYYSVNYKLAWLRKKKFMK